MQATEIAHRTRRANTLAELFEAHLPDATPEERLVAARAMAPATWARVAVDGAPETFSPDHGQHAPSQRTIRCAIHELELQARDKDPWAGLPS